MLRLLCVPLHNRVGQNNQPFAPEPLQKKEIFIV